MTIVDSRPEIRPVFLDRRPRRWAAAALVLGPLVMTTSFAIAAVVDGRTDGADDLEASQLQPALTGWSALFDLLTPPAMLAWGAVIFLIARRWAPRSAWTALVALVLQLFALAAVVGIQLITGLLYVDGVARDTIDKAMDDGLPGTVPGVVLMVWFVLCIPIGFVAIGIALWATRWVPRWIPIVFWLFPFGDMATPDHPKWIHVAVFGVLLAASAALARAVLRDGAPLPAGPGTLPDHGGPTSFDGRGARRRGHRRPRDQRDRALAAGSARSRGRRRRVRLTGLMWTLVFGSIGTLLLRDSPGNRLGPLCLAGIGLWLGAGAVAGSLQALVPEGGVAAVACAVVNGLWITVVPAVFLIPILYPDGAPSRHGGGGPRASSRA